MAEKNVLFMGSDALLQVSGITDVQTGDLINSATIELSIFEGAQRYPVSILAFTSGSVAIIEGDIITGLTSTTTTATVDKITLTGGSWAAGTAAGQLELSGQDGAFVSENIEVASSGDIATVPGDSTGLVCVQLGGGQVKIPMNTVGLTTSDFIRIESSKKYNGQFDIDAIDAGLAGYATITATNNVETFTGNELIYLGIVAGKDIGFTHDGGDPEGYYDAIQPDTLEGVYHGAEYYLFEKIEYAGNVMLHRYKWTADYYSKLAL